MIMFLAVLSSTFLVLGAVFTIIPVVFDWYDYMSLAKFNRIFNFGLICLGLALVSSTALDVALKLKTDKTKAKQDIIEKYNELTSTTNNFAVVTNAVEVK